MSNETMGPHSVRTPTGEIRPAYPGRANEELNGFRPTSTFNVQELLRGFEPAPADAPIQDTGYQQSYLPDAVPEDSTPKQPMIVVPDDIEVEEDSSFELDKCQVVRTEFFSNTREPAVTFTNYKIGFNTACVRKLPQVDYVQFLINSTTKKLAIRPCDESELHSFQWCTRKGDVKKPRQVTGKIFFMKVCSMMGWNPDYRYRILGKLIRANGQYLFVFDLTAREMYKRIAKDGEKPRASRRPIFPEEWRDQFGMPYEEHRKSLQINILDDYLVYGIRDKTQQDQAEQTDSTPLTGEIHDGGDQPWQKRPY